MSNDAVLEFGTPRENEERRDGGCAVVFDPVTQKYAVGERAKDGLFLLYSGGAEEGEAIKDAILREVTEESGLHGFKQVEKIAEALTHYYNRGKDVNRLAHATCLLVILNHSETVPTQLEAHEDFTLRWTTPSEILANWKKHNTDHSLDHWIYFLSLAVERAVELGLDTASDLEPCKAATAAVLAEFGIAS